jgi:hypothetical protein
VIVLLRLHFSSRACYTRCQAICIFFYVREEQILFYCKLGDGIPTFGATTKRMLKFLVKPFDARSYDCLKSLDACHSECHVKHRISTNEITDDVTLAEMS